MRTVIKSTKLFLRFERHENLAQAIALLEEAQICSSCVAFTLNAARKRNQSFVCSVSLVKTGNYLQIAKSCQTEQFFQTAKSSSDCEVS